MNNLDKTKIFVLAMLINYNIFYKQKMVFFYMDIVKLVKLF